LPREKHAKAVGKLGYRDPRISVFSVRKIVDLRNGIPSHDRFNAIFAAIKPAEFERCLLSWITAFHFLTSEAGLPQRGQLLKFFAAHS